MQTTLHTTEFSDPNSTSFDDDDFAPIDLGWRRKYYRSVLRKRIKSYLLDVIIVYAFLIILIVIAKFFGDAIGGGIFLFGFFGCFLGYPILVGVMESSKMKGFYGKRIMKIEVSDNYGNPISFWRSIWRNFLKGITYFFCLTLIGYFIQRYYYLKTGKFFHDNWSKTVIGERLKTA